MHHRADLAQLLEAGLMVPVHRGMVEHATALGARTVLLERSKPFDLIRATFPGLGDAEFTPPAW
jgi:hypothetical protein